MGVALGEKALIFILTGKWSFQLIVSRKTKYKTRYHITIIEGTNQQIKLASQMNDIDDYLCMCVELK